MKFNCQQCGAKYQIADERVAGKLVRMKCRKCSDQIRVRARKTPDGTVVPHYVGDAESVSHLPPASATAGSMRPAGSAVPPSARGVTVPARGAAARQAPNAAPTARRPGGTQLGLGASAISAGIIQSRRASAPPRPGGPPRPAGSGRIGVPRPAGLGAPRRPAPRRPAPRRAAPPRRPAPPAKPAAPATPAPSGAAPTEFDTEATMVMERSEFENRRRLAGLPGIGGAAHASVSAPASTAGPSSEPIWFVGIDEEPVGPVGADFLQEQLRAGKISRSSLVWRDGMGEWEKLDTIAELRGVLEASPPSVIPAPHPADADLNATVAIPPTSTAPEDDDFGIEDEATVAIAAPSAMHQALLAATPDTAQKKPASSSQVSSEAGSAASGKPISDVPPSKAPASQAPASKAPASKAPASKAPASQAPASKAPASQAPASKAPASKAPISEAAASEAVAEDAAKASEAVTVGAPAVDGNRATANAGLDEAKAKADAKAAVLSADDIGPSSSELVAAGLPAERRGSRRGMHPMAWAFVAMAAAFGAVAAWFLFGNKPPPTPTAATSSTAPTATPTAMDTTAVEPTSGAQPDADASTTPSGVVAVPPTPPSNGHQLAPSVGTPNSSATSTPPPKPCAPDDPLCDQGVAGPSSGAAHDADSSTGTGLSQEQLQAVVNRNRRAVSRKCLALVRTGSARVGVTIKVLRSGAVSSVSTSGGKGHPGLASCVDSRVRHWRFPRSGAATTVNVPFTFIAQ